MFKQILVKFQQEKTAKQQLSIVLWLKALLKIHWLTVVKRADPEDFKNISAIQAYINKKCKYMDKLLVLQGKIDMASKLLDIKAAKPKDQVAQQEQEDEDEGVLVY